MKRCEPCRLTLPADQMNVHLQGKRHARTFKKWEKTVIVTCPENITQQVVQVLANYGPSTTRRLNSQRLIVQYWSKNSANAILRDTVRVKGVQLDVQRDTKAKGLLGSESAANRTPRPEVTSEISYDKIKHIFTEENTFDDQLRKFLYAIQPSAEDRLRYDATWENLTKFLRSKLNPSCTLYQFGSVQTGLALKDSDLDVCVDIGKLPDESHAGIPREKLSQKIFTEIGRLMRKHRHMFGRLLVLGRARVPIIRFHYRPTNVCCDMSVGTELGYYKGILIRFFVERDPRVKPLLMVLRYWAMQFQLSGTGRISSYALCCLVIFYLQQPDVGILPPVTALMDPNQQTVVDGWPVNFDVNAKLPPVTNTSTVPELIGGFFRFYAKYDYQSLIMCPLDGKSYRRSEFEDHENLPDYMDSYKSYMNDQVNPHKFSLNACACVQDPIMLGSNAIASASHRLIEKFAKYCELGAILCQANSSGQYRGLMNVLFTSYTETDTETYGMFFRLAPVRFATAKSVMEMVNQGKMEEAVLACCLLFVYFLKDVLERLFRLTVQVRTTRLESKAEQVGSWMEEKVRRIEFDCRGKYYEAWSNIDLEKARLTPNEDPLPGLTRLGASIEQELSGTEESLRFTCTFQPRKVKKNLHILLKNNKTGPCRLKEFSNVLKKHQGRLLELMIPHMNRYNDYLQPENARV